MKNLQLIFGITLIITGSFILGYSFGNKGTNNSQNNISFRYFKVYGNPKTAEEQCKYDYIIYNDSTECE